MRRGQPETPSSCEVTQCGLRITVPEVREMPGPSGHAVSTALVKERAVAKAGAQPV